MIGMNYPDQLRTHIKQDGIVPLIGAYDTFSASIAARHFDGIFISGFSFAASFYGLPDIGFISWSDITAFTQRVRTLLPTHHIVVDMDDGYCDTDVACHVAGLLEDAGASGIILEDQKRPRRCGHLGGKQIMDLEEFLDKLNCVLTQRNHLFVVARTDATEQNEILRRIEAFAKTDADAILADGLTDFSLLKSFQDITDKPIVFNQIYGGKSPAISLPELKAHGVSLVNYSTPCISAAQSAINASMEQLKAQQGLLSEDLAPGVALNECNQLLNENLMHKNMKATLADLGSDKDPINPYRKAEEID